MASTESIHESSRSWSNPGAKPELHRQISQK